MSDPVYKGNSFICEININIVGGEGEIPLVIAT